MSFEWAIRRGTALAFACALLAGVQPCWAASAEEKAAARRHATEARTLAQRGQLEQACKHWEEVEKLDPRLPTLIELAECTEGLGKLVQAHAYWGRARERAKREEKPQSRARAEAKLGEVDKRIPRLTLLLAADAAGAQVLCDDVALAPAAVSEPLLLDPGEHSIVVRLAGRDDAKYPVKLVEGDRRTLAIAAGAVPGVEPVAAPAASAPTPLVSAPPSPSPVPSAPAAPAPTGWWTKQRTAGAVLGGAGLGAVGAGTALCVMASKDGSSVDHRLSAGAIALVSGGVLLVTGVALLASGPEAGQSAAVRITPRLLVAPGVAGLGATGSF